jgi:hypothetical protein
MKTPSSDANVYLSSSGTASGSAGTYRLTVTVTTKKGAFSCLNLFRQLKTPSKTDKGVTETASDSLEKELS